MLSQQLLSHDSLGNTSLWHIRRAAHYFSREIIASLVLRKTIFDNAVNKIHGLNAHLSCLMENAGCRGKSWK